jgi:pimeloyl-ACP methyl ester carboxylesterase
MNIIQGDHLQYEYVLEHPGDRTSRGSILLVHGSAPFNLDGRIPIDSDSPYARTAFYRDLSRGLRTAGWSTLRYNKPGVHEDRVEVSEYATSDFDVLGKQLVTLWAILPTERPRIVFAWSEGSLHVRALPMHEVDAVALLGGIATTIGDVIRAQGGPSRDQLQGELAGKDRREMFGIDRPVGRMLDELAFMDNWRAFSGPQSPPLLILHGDQDREVPVTQVKVWEDRLPNHHVKVVIGRGYDHRFMPQDVYDPMLVAKEITSWLDGLFPVTNNR